MELEEKEAVAARQKKTDQGPNSIYQGESSPKICGEEYGELNPPFAMKPLRGICTWVARAECGRGEGELNSKPSRVFGFLPAQITRS